MYKQSSYKYLYDIGGMESSNELVRSAVQDVSKPEL